MSALENKRLIIRRVHRTLIKSLKKGSDVSSAKEMFLYIADNMQDPEKEWDLIINSHYSESVLETILRKTPWRDSDRLFDFVRDDCFIAYLNKYGTQDISDLKKLQPLHDKIISFLAEGTNEGIEN
jgi:hypothetical protein